ncbi:hypothetical protein [Anabaena sp. 4-3]|nr:hypothetical protein [Anabaena sp. 4-3]
MQKDKNYSYQEKNQKIENKYKIIRLTKTSYIQGDGERKFT